MSKPEIEPFTEVQFCRAYPRYAVPEHEVLMSFNGDSDAIAFREWWDDKGAALFAKWLPKNKRMR